MYTETGKISGASLIASVLLAGGLLLAGCGDSDTGGSSSSATSSAATSSAAASSVAVADFGDAPDGEPTGYPVGFAQTGKFPSLLASNGARTVDVSNATLGPDITAETDAILAGDTDDGIVSLFTTLTQIPPPTAMTVNVTADASAAGGSYYLNTLIDLNMDGEWGGMGASGESEWVVQNYPVNVAPGVVTPVTPPSFAFTNGNRVPSVSWMRIALTKEMVPDGWDGTGEFTSGEIEDHIIEMPLVNGKEVPMLTVDCGGPYKFEDKTVIDVTCTVTNLRDVAGNFSHSLVHEPNGGTVQVANCLPASPIAIGALAAQNVVCKATKGNTPDAWTFKATAIDPPSVVKDDGSGILLGHDETATTQVNFRAVAVQALYLVSMSTSFVHTVPGVYSEIFISGILNVTLANIAITLAMVDPFGVVKELSAITNAQGAFSLAVKIYSYGLYNIAIQNMLAEGYAYDAEQNEANATQEVDVK